MSSGFEFRHLNPDLTFLTTKHQMYSLGIPSKKDPKVKVEDPKRLLAAWILFHCSLLLRRIYLFLLYRRVTKYHLAI